jgi:hypothetical protein
MTEEKIKQLNEEQLEDFNKEYVDDVKWNTISSWIEHNFPEKKFSFLDIGGGNGKFADRLLNSFTQSTGTVLDNASTLLELNEINPRKTLVLGSVENLNQIFVNSKFDLVFFNWVLHHFVNSSYQETRKTQLNALVNAQTLLSDNGYISLFENMYDGIIFKNLPGRLIFHLTSSKILAPLTSKMGANTAGCGVCFLSQGQWESTVTKAGLVICQYTDYERWSDFSIFRKTMLHIGPVRWGHFWLKKGTT